MTLAGAGGGARRSALDTAAGECGPQAPARGPGWVGMLLLAVVVALSRLPFLGDGYGSDMDAWSVASAARWISEHGAYGASRFPGHPVQELTCALLWRGGPWALNGATATMSVAAAVAFAVLLTTLRVPHAWLGGLALAFTPAVFIHSTDSMDFVWALAFLIGATAAAVRGRGALAGVMLGLAIGCRISSAAMFPTVALLIAARSGSARAAARPLGRFLAGSVVAGGLALAPMIARFGWTFLSVNDSPHTVRAIDVLKNGTLEVWGLPGSLGWAAVAVAALASRRLRAPPVPRRELAAWLLAIGVFVAGFVRLPFDAGYLLPAVPVALLLAGRLLAARAFALLCASVIVSAVTLEVAEIGKPDSPTPSPLSVTLQIAGRPVVIDALQGPMVWDRERRRAQLRHRDRIRAAADVAADGDGGTVMIISDGWTAYLGVDHHAATPPGRRFVHRLDAARAAELRRGGVRIFYLPEAQWNYRAVHGVGLESLGAAPLPGLGTSGLPQLKGTGR